MFPRTRLNGRRPELDRETQSRAVESTEGAPRQASAATRGTGREDQGNAGAELRQA
ncbi:hypothetical protein RHMOL_Rhmol09G0021300 [Rhododendron molle]|uniref:Uncharacterized protein n=1 Tax=Rhododendron molle TaxID=49168 RepID=A0ACC0M9G2_RHOML|nr:hypothetical protein RHMOL_Rhmol09G0021300 [Rhododendron molle]